jgi:hypothetical protein
MEITMQFLKMALVALFLSFAVVACEYKYPDLNVGGGNDSPQVSE